MSTAELDTIADVITTSRRILFILCGLPYAGKTYVAQRLQNESDITYVSIDSIFQKRGFNWDSNTLPDAKEWQDIFQESYKNVGHALTEGKNVLYDSTNHTRASRDMLRTVAQTVGADVRVIFVNASVESIWKRWEINSLDPTRSVISRELVQQTIDAFEIPDSSEQVIEIVNN